MKNGKLKIIISCCLLVLSINSNSFADSEKTHEHFKNVLEIKWHHLQDGLDIAKKEEKITMIMFSADWCEPCHDFNSKTYTDKNVINELSKFINIKVDVGDMNNDVKKLFDKYQINGELPGIVFIDKNGEILSEYSISGFKKAEDFIQTLKSVNSSTNN